MRSKETEFSESEPAGASRSGFRKALADILGDAGFAFGVFIGSGSIKTGTHFRHVVDKWMRDRR